MGNTVCTFGGIFVGSFVRFVVGSVVGSHVGSTVGYLSTFVLLRKEKTNK